jgi:D-lactate dehydrogenase
MEVNKVAVFSAQEFEKSYLNSACDHHFQLDFFNSRLEANTAQLAQGYSLISCFVTDCLAAETLEQLNRHGVKFIALRSAGFNHVDLNAANRLGIIISRVPDYSPYAVAEFAVALILSLNRKIHRAYTHTHEHNFLLQGLLGFDLHGRTVGVIGTGKIGSVFCKIMLGFGCKVIAFDPMPNAECKAMGVNYLSLDELYANADIVSLHCPLTDSTRHIIQAESLAKMKTGVMLINTGRGALLDSQAVITALKSKKVGYLGIDVYEEEENLFFRDLSSEIIQDDIFVRLESFPNVLITGHQAFFTIEALTNIATTTALNLRNFISGIPSVNVITSTIA